MKRSRITHRLSIVDSVDGLHFSFTQDPAKFYEPLVNIYRQIPSRKFDPNSKIWQFSVQHKEQLFNKIEEHLPEVEIIRGLSRRGTDSSSAATIPKPTCMFILCDVDRFEIISSYDQQLNNVYKSMESRCYNARSRSWNFNIRDHDKLVTALKDANVQYTICSIPAWILRYLKNHQERKNDINYEDICSQRLNEQLLSQLLPFQREALIYALVNDGRLLLADDMGLGKTLQALSMALLYRSEWPLLIIVPASVKYSWQDQILKWIPNILVDEIHIIDKQCDSISSDYRYPITIVSYDCLAKQTFRTKLLCFKVIIADESHQLKNIKTSRCKHVIPLLKQAKRLFLLSGTPALSRPFELYPQLHCLYPQLFRNLHDFGKRYCGAKQTPWGWEYSGCTNINELQIILECGLMIRRDKQSVLKDLPNKYREIVVLDAAKVKTNSAGLIEASKRAVNAKSKDKHACLLSFFHETARAKMDGVCEYLKTHLNWNEKTIIFAHHQVMMDNISCLCETMAIEYIRIDGSVGSQRRQNLVDRFQLNDNVKIAVLAVITAGTGLNLTAASKVIFAELFWNPGVLLQAEDRAYRLGREDSLEIKYLLAKNTSDDLVWPLVQRKLKVLSEVGLSKRDALSTEKIDKHSDSINDGLVTANDKHHTAMFRLLDEFITSQSRANMHCEEELSPDFNAEDEIEDDELLVIANSLNQ
ncbi:hypothetical protein GJ496_005258 [Pomphorhynchus laevis]|nr:hypothetical protein GJ496_005258 [Pomphorhynchus laevis]